MNKKLTKQELMAIQPFIRHARDILGAVQITEYDGDAIIKDLEEVEDKLWFLQEKVKKALTTLTT